jgi:uncharacterized membrane protein YqjE
MSEPETGRARLGGLLRRVPQIVSQLIRDEVRLAKVELLTKAKAARLGAGLTAAGAILALFAFGTLITSAIAGLDEVLPEWLAALIVAVVLAIAAAILIPIGIQRLKRGIPPVPSETIDSVRDDVRVVKGTWR